MRICPKCGYTTSESESFCKNCGGHLETKEKVIRKREMLALLMGILVIFAAVTGGIIGYSLHSRGDEYILDNGSKISNDDESISDEQNASVLSDMTTGLKTEGKKTGFETALHGKKIESGECGDYVKWALYEDGMLYIYGKGKMKDKSSGSIINSHNNKVKNIYIDSGVESISDYAFSGCKLLESVEIPASVISVGNWAFDGCDLLNSIYLEDGVEKILSYAFCGCSSLNNVIVPDSVTLIGYGAFENCSSLNNIVIPDDLEDIRESAFDGCASLGNIGISGSVANKEDYIGNSNTYEYPMEVFCKAIKKRDGEMMSYIFHDEMVEYLKKNGYDMDDIIEDCQDICEEVYEDIAEELGMESGVSFPMDVSPLFGKIEEYRENKIEEVNQRLRSKYEFKNQVEEVYRTEVNLEAKDESTEQTYKIEMGVIMFGKIDGHWYMLPD